MIGDLMDGCVFREEVLGLVTELDEGDGPGKAKKKIVFRMKVANASLRRLISGAIAGALSRTAVAPLETIRTNLMVRTGRRISVAGMFHTIMERDGWRGLFRGNGVNVLRVAPSKAIEVKDLKPHSIWYLSTREFFFLRNISVVCAASCV